MRFKLGNTKLLLLSGLFFRRPGSIFCCRVLNNLVHVLIRSTNNDHDKAGGADKSCVEKNDLTRHAHHKDWGKHYIRVSTGANSWKRNIEYPVVGAAVVVRLMAS